MRKALFAILGMAAMFVACSQTVSASSNDDEEKASATDSSDSKGTGDGSSGLDSSEDVLDKDCVGESGKPWDGTTAKEFACGSGTKLSPFIILTAEQLAHLSFVINAKDKSFSDKYYKLAADIKLNDGKVIDDKGALVADSAKLHKWTPIGNSSVAFTGNFDGNGHTVSGMFINTTSTHNGLFGNNRGSIHSLDLDNSWVYGGKQTGGVVGYNVGTVQKVTNYGSVSGIEDCVGGVVGNSNQKDYKDNSTLKNLLNMGVVTGKKNVGGVAGCAANVTADSLENRALIEGYGFVGGVFGGIGGSSKNDIRNSRNTGKINGLHFVGGVSGHCGASLSISSQDKASYSCPKLNIWECGNVTKAYNNAIISGKNYVGGIFGVACNGSISSLGNVADIEGDYGIAGVVGSVSFIASKSLYNKGNVNGKTYVGGIFSYNQEGVTSSAYSSGKVDGDSLVGLMIGYNYNTTMADYYYLKQGDQEPFGQNNGGGVATPKIASEMKSADFAKLLGDDFVYDSGLNDGYPVLAWEKE